jgi:hypothetical protein
MALKVTLSNPTARKVAFSQTEKPLTLRSSASVTSLSGLTDIDTTTSKADGAALIYDADTNTFKSQKVFEELPDGTYELRGGDF